MATLTVLRVFCAGPRDVNDERVRFREVVEELDRRVARNLGFRVEPRGWEDTMPGCGRPQELINKDVDECNLFVLSLFMRWGTPTGEYSAGVEEEFERALARHNATGEPEIWLFFRDIAENSLVDPGDQLKQVLAFRGRIERERALLHKAHRDPAHWAIMFGDFLSEWLFQSKARGGPGPGDRLPALPPPREFTPGSEYITSTTDLQAEVERLRAQVQTAETKLREACIHALVQAGALEEQGRVTEAETAFVHALDLYELPEGRNGFGVFLARAGRLRDAVSQFERSCQLKPDMHEALYNWGTALTYLAKALWEAGEREEARRLYGEAFKRYAQAVAVKPDMHEALYNWGTALTDLAKALWEAGEQEEARRLYEEGFERYGQAVAVKPDKHEALNNWGISLTDLAKALWEAGEQEEAWRLYEEALERYGQAVTVKPDDHEALYNWGTSLAYLAKALWEAGEWEEARRLYEEGFERYGQAVAVKPDMHEALNNWGNALTDLAKALWEAGEQEEARRLYEEGFERYGQAVAVKPDMHEALYNWGVTLREYAGLAPPRRSGAIVREANRKLRQAEALAQAGRAPTVPPAPSRPAPA